jgi:hypothetical protein
VPEIPTQCIAATDGDGGVCSIGVHHRRSRKTGPSHPVAVARCRTHRVSFTLYPPGYVPYGREAVAPVDAEGQLVHDVEDGKVGGVEPELAWDATIFRAARDAEQRLAWPRESSMGATGSWRSQGRWIAMAAALLGLTTDAIERWPLIGLVGVPALVLREASEAYASAKGYVARGRAVTLVLSALALTGCRLLDKLLQAGSRANRWGPPLRWDSRAKRLCHLVGLPRPP